MVINEKDMDYFKLKSPVGIYYVNISTEYDMFNRPSKIIYNLDRCVTISISPLTNIATLEQLYYEGRCNKHKNLERGRGTRDMLHASFALVKRLYPYITLFRLRDSSYKSGDDGISLFHSYICLYGETWYEKHFSAKFTGVTKEHSEKYDRCISKMVDKDYKSSIPLERFQDMVGRIFTDDIQLLYTESKTFVDFFNLLFNRHNKKYTPYITFIKPWVINFIDIHIFEKDIYLINEYYGIVDLEYIDHIRYNKIHEIPKKYLMGGDSKKYTMLYRYSLWADP
jgi:hypothetical protein